jgi:hypothetical protein
MPQLQEVPKLAACLLAAGLSTPEGKGPRQLGGGLELLPEGEVMIGAVGPRRSLMEEIDFVTVSLTPIRTRTETQVGRWVGRYQSRLPWRGYTVMCCG